MRSKQYIFLKYNKCKNEEGMNKLIDQKSMHKLMHKNPEWINSIRYLEIMQKCTKCRNNYSLKIQQSNGETCAVAKRARETNIDVNEWMNEWEFDVDGREVIDIPLLYRLLLERNEQNTAVYSEMFTLYKSTYM